MTVFNRKVLFHWDEPRRAQSSWQDFIKWRPNDSLIHNIILRIQPSLSISYFHSSRNDLTKINLAQSKIWCLEKRKYCNYLDKALDLKRVKWWKIGRSVLTYNDSVEKCNFKKKLTCAQKVTQLKANLWNSNGLSWPIWKVILRWWVRNTHCLCPRGSLPLTPSDPTWSLLCQPTHHREIFDVVR